MPKVGGRHFAYTPEGKEAAERYKQSIGMQTGGLMHEERGADAQTQAEGLMNIGVDYGNIPNIHKYRANTALVGKYMPHPGLRYLINKDLGYIDKEIEERRKGYAPQLSINPEIDRRHAPFVKAASAGFIGPTSVSGNGGEDMQVSNTSGTNMNSLGLTAEQDVRDPANMAGGGMMGFRPLGYADGDLVSARPYTSAAKERFAEGVAGTINPDAGRPEFKPLDLYDLTSEQKYRFKIAFPDWRTVFGKSPKAEDRTVAQERALNNVLAQVKGAKNWTGEELRSLARFGGPDNWQGVGPIPDTSDLPVGVHYMPSTKTILEVQSVEEMAGGGMMGFRPLGYADGDLVEEYVYPDKESRQSAINFIATMTQAGDATIEHLLNLSDSDIRRAYDKVMADTEAGKYDHVILPHDIRLPPEQTGPSLRERFKGFLDQLTTSKSPAVQRAPSQLLGAPADISNLGRMAGAGDSRISDRDAEFASPYGQQLYEENLLAEEGPGNFPVNYPSPIQRNRGGIMALRRY